MKKLQNELSYLRQCLEALKQCEGTNDLVFEVKKEICRLENKIETRALWIERLSMIGGAAILAPLIYAMVIILYLVH